MTDHFVTSTTRIRALNSSLMSLLRGEQGASSVPLQKIRESAAYLADSYQEILNMGSKQLASGLTNRYAETITAVESAYTGWRGLDDAFVETLNRAYGGLAPRACLQLDVLHEGLRRRVGEPISGLYARLYATWSDHLGQAPWDAYMAQRPTHIDQHDFDRSLQALVHGDHLDVEDAIEDLTGPRHRHLFATYLGDSEAGEMVEQSLWMRPEIIVMNDYWTGSNIRLLDIIRRRGTSRTRGAFAQVQDLFTTGRAETTSNPDDLAESVRRIYPDDRDAYYRCLMLHPDGAVRRFAARNVDVEGFWKIITPRMVPCATILSMLERIAGSKGYDENFQRIFFNTIHRRLLSLTTRSEVIYARGIVRIFAQLPFFMEDAYFEKLMQVVDFIKTKEPYFKISDGVLDEYIGRFKREKQAVGSVQSNAPGMATIPPVVLRKLARDGHFWLELASHPMFKIARETIVHINSEDRAVRIARHHGVNQDVLRAVGKNRALFKTLTSKVALLTNPRTPPTVSLGYVNDLSRRDVEMLLRKSTVHAELRQYLRQRLNR